MSQEQISKSNIADRRNTIDEIDAQIISLIQMRTQESQAIVAERMAAGGPRIAQNREQTIIHRYEAALGSQGRTIALATLALGRGIYRPESESE
jgi:chorismate mutase